MKIARSKIHNYISEVSSLFSTVIDNKNIKQDFFPTHILKIAISTCSMLHKNRKIKCYLPHNPYKVTGNPATYLEATTLLLNSVANCANENIYLQLKSDEAAKNIIRYTLVVSLPNSKAKAFASHSTSLNYQLNYDFFIIKKLLNKIDGKFLIHDDNEYGLNFIIEVDFHYTQGGP